MAEVIESHPHEAPSRKVSRWISSKAPRNSCGRESDARPSFLLARAKSKCDSTKTEDPPILVENLKLSTKTKSIENVVSTKKFTDLPPSVQLECVKLNLDPKKTDIDITILWTAAEFVMTKHFPTKHIRRSVGNASRSDENFLTVAESLIRKTDEVKTLQKKFKGMEFDAEGGYGRIFKARHKIGGGNHKVAVKILPHNNTKQKEHNLREVGFLFKCNHPNIVRHVDSYITKLPDGKEEIWIAMEYIEGGTLSLAAKSQQLYELQMACIAKELLKALKFLHGNHYAHRDLKSSNIMVSTSGHVKLVDFGLCTDFSLGPRTEMVGSPFWMPPEMIQKLPHSCPVDIWSLGVCLLELVTGHPPYHESSLLCLYKVGTEGLLDMLGPAHLTSETKDFLSRCLQMNPNHRTPVSQLLEHQWVNQNNMEKGLKWTVQKLFVYNSFDTIVM